MFWHNRKRKDSGSLVRVHRVVVNVFPPTFSLIQSRSPRLFWDKKRLLGVCPFVAEELFAWKTSDEPISGCSFSSVSIFSFDLIFKKISKEIRNL